MQTTFPRLMLQHASQRPQQPALREKEYGIWQTVSWSQLAELVRHLAGGLAQAGLKRGQHIVVVGENRPNLSAVMLAAQSLGAIPVPLYQDAATTEFAFPINNAEVAFAVVEDQEQVDKMLELRSACPQLKRVWYDDPRGLRNYNEPGLASLDSLIEAGRAFHAQQPGFFEAEVRKGQPDDVAAMFFTSGTTGNPEGRRAHARLADRPRTCRRGVRQADGQRRGARVSAAGVDRPEHLLVCAVARLRLCRQLSRVGEHGDDRHERDRPDLLLRAAPRVRRPADDGDDPHGGRRPRKEVAVPSLHERRSPRRARADGRQAHRLARPPALRARQPVHLRTAAQHARPVARACRVHRR